MAGIKYLSNTSPKKLRGTALVRLDFNTSDTWRLKTSVSTLKFLLSVADKIIIVSHRGRPELEKRGDEEFVGVKKGKPFFKDSSLTLARDAVALSRFLRKPVTFFPNFDFSEIRKRVEESKRGSVFVLENIRFLKGEATPAPELAKQLSALGDYYVNEAFAVSHRDSDTVAKIERFLPSYGGFELEREIKNLTAIKKNPAKPVVVIVGGAKAQEKLGIIKSYRNIASHFLLGGAPANTVLYLQGKDVKKSLRDLDPKDLTQFKQILKFGNLEVPEDVIWQNDKIVDIGPKTLARYKKIIATAATILWSGPVGWIERKPYDKGSLILAKAVTANKKAFSATGGGETVAFLKKHHLDKKISFVSTGGGAMLEFLEGKELPGIKALRKN